ncbi:FecR family protein [Flavitalea sp.]|nr:FecR domain-containing protein [Flavitalea sp.]
MEPLNDRLNYLLRGYQTKTLDAQEHQELLQLLEAKWQESGTGTSAPLVDWEKMFEDVIATPVLQTDRKVFTLNQPWFKYAAAILIIFGTISYVYLYNGRSAIQKEQKATASKIHDVAPAGMKAMLTLADGSTIILDSVANGPLVRQGDFNVVKRTNGQLEYQALAPLPDSSAAAASGFTRNTSDSLQNNRVTGFNTMSTPKGGQFQLRLPDGSRVWLNAASSITFPTAFVGKERTVSIQGEAFFEVAKDANMPFIVKIRNNDDVKVLGTKFNVNVYGDEPGAITTLIEGSIKIAGNVMSPGYAYNNGQLVRADTSKAVAWKNGLFNFNKSSLQQVMFEIARWYDVEVVYEKEVPNIQLWGKVGRDLSLTQVLSGLHDMHVNYRLEKGKRLVILP